MINGDIVRGRISIVRKNMIVLREIAETPIADFKKDQKDIAATERLIQVSIESLLDAGNHIIAAERVGVPERYSEIGILLSNVKILSKPEGEILSQMAKMRNILVHSYFSIDPHKLFKILTQYLDDFEIICQSFLKHIK